MQIRWHLAETRDKLDRVSGGRGVGGQGSKISWCRESIVCQLNGTMCDF